MLEITTHTLQIAVAQWDCQRDAPAANRHRSLQWIEEAAAAGADLLLLPELCISGYNFNDQAHANALAEPPDGPTECAWREAAAAHNIAVAGGLAIQHDHGLTNSLVCITPEGEVTRYHKVHLFDQEQRFFVPGERLQTWTWRGITFGLMICYDGWFPEVPRALTLAGADMLLAPGCWHERPPLAGALSPGLLLHTAAAYTNSVFVACASRTGQEGVCSFAGGSAIIEPDGQVTGPAPTDEDALLSTTIDLRKARFKYRTKRIHPLKNRRPDLYHSLVKAPKSR